jgi:hypothetical protein
MHKKILSLLLISSVFTRAMDTNNNSLNKRSDKPRVHNIVLWALRDTPLSHDLKKDFCCRISEYIGDKVLPQETQHLKAILFVNAMIRYLPIINREIIHLRLARIKVDEPDLNEIPVSIVTRPQMDYYYVLSGLNHLQYPDYFEKYLRQDNKGLAILIEKQEADRARLQEPAFFYTTKKLISLNEHFKPEIEKFLARLYEAFPRHLKRAMDIEFPPFLNFETMSYVDKRRTLKIAELLFDPRMQKSLSLSLKIFKPKKYMTKKAQIEENFKIVKNNLNEIKAPKEMLLDFYDWVSRRYGIMNLPE